VDKSTLSRFAVRDQPPCSQNCRHEPQEGQITFVLRRIEIAPWGNLVSSRRCRRLADGRRRVVSGSDPLPTIALRKAVIRGLRRTANRGLTRFQVRGAILVLPSNRV